MLEFMVLSAPRSASTWAANWLTSATTLCLHDPVLEYRIEAFDRIPCDRRLGISCTALALLPDLVNSHPCPKLIVHRNLKDVNESLETIGLTPLTARWDGALRRLQGLHLSFERLFDPRYAAQVHEHLTGQPFDAARHALLCAMYVEPHFPKVKVRPQRAREFRQRIERAFA